VAQAETLEEVREALLASTERLRELELFDGVDVLIDSSSEARGNAGGPPPLTPPQGGPGTADLVVTVKEKSVLSLHTGTYVQARGNPDRGALSLTRSRARRGAWRRLPA